jgi:gamma-glutamyl-gamma-aminobutyrate hydrolase PuuD
MVLVTMRFRAPIAAGAGAERMPGWWLHEALLDAVIGAGAVPCPVAAANCSRSDLTTLAERYLDLASGLLLGGGDDIEWRPAGPDGTIRDGFELRLLEGALRRSMPVLGICRGAQLLHLWSGGELVRDASEVHSQPHRYPDHHHVVELSPSSILNPSTVPLSIRVNSALRWSMVAPNPAVRVLAQAADSTIEAIELRAHRSVRGLMWHPEFGSCAVSRRAISDFLTAAGTYRLAGGHRD